MPRQGPTYTYQADGTLCTGTTAVACPAQESKVASDTETAVIGKVQTETSIKSVLSELKLVLSEIKSPLSELKSPLSELKSVL